AEATKGASRLGRGAKAVVKAGGDVAKGAGKVLKIGTKGIPFIGAGVGIGGGIYHLSEGRGLRAGVGFAKGVTLVGDACFDLDVGLPALWDYFASALDAPVCVGAGSHAPRELTQCY